MSGAEKSFHYFISETQVYDPREMAFEIAAFFAKQHKNVAIIMKSPKISPAEAVTHFGSLSTSEHKYVKFMYCKEYSIVLKRLLEIDSVEFVPHVIIVQSLQQWYDAKTVLNKLPLIYASICSAAIDVINHLAKTTNQDCFSFITTDTDEFPRCLHQLLYDKVTIGRPTQVRELLEKHKKPDED